MALSHFNNLASGLNQQLHPHQAQSHWPEYKVEVYYAANDILKCENPMCHQRKFLNE